MKKLYSISLMLMIGLLSFVAKADWTISLKVNDAEHFTGYVQYNDGTYQQVDLNMAEYAGEGGTITLPDAASYAYIYLNTTDNYIITSFKNESTGNSSQGVGNTSANMYCSPYQTNTIVAECKSEAEARPEKCVVICDDYSVVALSRKTNSTINLNSDTTIVAFMESEAPFYARHNTYGKSIYKITVNENTINASGSQYEIPVVNGDTVRIYANYPDIDVPVKFTFTEDAEDCLSSVTVDGNKVDNFKDENFTVKLGSVLQFTGNTNEYQFNSVKVNNSTVYFYGSYQFTVNTEETQTIDIDATKYGKIIAYITVDNPENITIYSGYSSSGDIINLNAGEKTAVELNSNNPVLSWKANDNCYISSATYTLPNGTTQDKTNTTSIYGVAENSELTFVTGKIVRDSVATIWVDDIDATAYGHSFMSYYDRANKSLVTGENVINFFEKDNPFALNLYQPTYNSVYQNGILIDPVYPGSANYNITLAHGDYVKVFLATDPEECAVTFTVKEETPEFVVKVDDVAYANYANGFTAIKGAVVSVVGENLKVSVNGEEVSATENVFNITVNDATTAIEIAGSSSGIENIENNCINSDIYNLQGIVVRKNATSNDVNELPAGLYIINGKKVLIRK